MSVSGPGAAGRASGVQGGNYQQVDLQTLMMMVYTERSNILDAQVRDQANGIKSKNQQLQEANAMLAKMRSDSNSGGGIPSDVKAYLDSKGISYPNADGDNTYSKEEKQVIVENIKNYIDSLTSTSQLDMAQLQSTMGKYNQTFEAMSNFINKYSSSLNSIVGNLRG